MNKTEDQACGVVQDILPLYVDKACSEQSNQLVEAHIRECDVCRRMLIEMREDIELPPVNEQEQQEVKAIQSLAKAWKKSKLIAWLTGVLIATLVCSIVIISYIALSEWVIVPVPAEKFKVTDVYELSDGSISYRLTAVDGFEIHSIVHTYDEFGNSYQLGYRPIVKRKASTEYGLHNQIIRIKPNEEHTWKLSVSGGGLEGEQPSLEVMNHSSDQMSWYYGTEDDRILIWEQGMEVPTASEELEKYWFSEN
ncbi:zf-HC2 domain-containing protein [Paenibacillus septentrionalis]|uniref:Zf-HC2 domain-containing protein n=1 Tax=Paenibacillus septentrionalis TaxID=429342 RepID=A0ABW1VB30_9BACL